MACTFLKASIYDIASHLLACSSTFSSSIKDILDALGAGVAVVIYASHVQIVLDQLQYRCNCW